MTIFGRLVFLYFFVSLFLEGSAFLYPRQGGAPSPSVEGRAGEIPHGAAASPEAAAVLSVVAAGFPVEAAVQAAEAQAAVGNMTP